MGFLGLNYHRPAQQPMQRVHPATSQESLSDSALQSIRSSTSAGIPDALSFDRIIAGGTCPPCTVRDFMNYLIYIEHSAENLQFFLWYRSFASRFYGATTSDIGLAPEWTQEMQEETFSKLMTDARDKMKRDPAHVASVFVGTDFEKRGNTGLPGNSSTFTLDRPSAIFSEMGTNPFSTPPRTPIDGDRLSTFSGGNATNIRSQVAQAFVSAGAKVPFTIQPFREEIDRVIAAYIMDGAPRQLNLSARERKQVLIALSHTTHPSAFRQVTRSIESSLRTQSHPNFIRWSICNGNPPRVTFANLLGAFLIVGSLLAYILLLLSSAPRGFRALPAISMVLGVSTQCAALKGMCVVLHGMHHRHVRPWELFVDEEVELRDEKEGGGFKESFESFESSNSYEDEPWVVKYQKRNLVRKVFDREVWIQEPALRSIQDTIFVQAMLLALVTAGVLTAIFVCVPGGGFY